MNDIIESRFNDLEKFAEWFNNTQWRGGKGDPIKQLFCKCDYKGIVEQYITEQNMTGNETNAERLKILGYGNKKQMTTIDKS